MAKHARVRIGSLYVSNGADAGGNQIFDVAISILVVTVAGFSATEVGLMNALGSASFLLLAVPAGALVDRVGAARTLVLSLATKVLLIAAAVRLAATERLSTPAILAIVTALGVCHLVTENAQVSTVPRLTSDPTRIASTVAKMAAADNIAGVLAPAIAAFLIVQVGGTWTLGVSLLLITLAALAALRVRRNARQQEADLAGSGNTPTAGLFEGFRVLVRNRLLLGTTVLIAAGNIGLAIGDSVEAILVLRVLDLGVLFYGALGTIAACAGLLASVVAPRIVQTIPVKRIFVIGAIAQALVAALPLVALLNPQSAHVILAVFQATWAIVLTVTNIAGSAYAAQTVPPDVLGRAIGARRMLTMGSVPIAALGGGILADQAGILIPLIVWPSLTLVAAVAFLALSARTAETATAQAS